MKSKKFLAFLAAFVLATTSISSLVGCATGAPIVNGGYYIVAVDPDMPTVIDIGDTVDFKQYFVVLDQNYNRIMVTDQMIDASKADTSKEGQFTVTLSIGNASQDVTFTVKNGGNGGEDDNKGNGNNGDDDNKGNGDDTADLSAVLSKYAGNYTPNFAVRVDVTSAEADWTDYYEYLGYDILYKWESTSGNYWTEYLSYDASSDIYYFYYANEDGTYTKIDENSDEFDESAGYMTVIELSEMSKYAFVAENGGYVANKPNDVGDAVFGKYTGSTWTTFKLTIANGNIKQIDATSSDGYTYKCTFSKFGTVSFTLPGVGSSTPTPVEPTGVMSKQVYNAATFDDERLQKKLVTVGDEPDFAIGLPSTGTYSALVVPIKFSNTTISSEQTSISRSTAPSSRRAGKASRPITKRLRTAS